MNTSADKPALKVVKPSLTITVLTNANDYLTKTYSRENGEIVKRTAAQMYEGNARRVALDGLAGLADVLTGLTDRQALTYGVTVKANVTVVTKKKVKDTPGGGVIRNYRHLNFHEIFFDLGPSRRRQRT